MVRLRFHYTLATLAWMFAIPCAMGALAPGPTAPATWAILCVSTVVAALCLVREARQDSYSFAQYSVVALLFPLTLAIATLFVAESTRATVAAAACCAACVALLVLAVLALWRGHHLVDELPNVLQERFGKEALFETDGVQFTAEHGQGDVAAGSWVRIFLQSCVAAERTVRISLDGVSGVLQRSGGLCTPALEPVELAPGEMGALLVPVRPGARPQRETHVYLTVHAHGAGGRRLRKLRARVPTTRRGTGFQLFSLLGGYLVCGAANRTRARLRRGA
ncbi:MAG: hypothetical protein WKG00_41385 [Polyangiaceae bacterium]